MRQQQPRTFMELYNNVMKNDSKEMLSIDIIFLLSDSFVNSAFNIITKYNQY